MGIVKDPIKNLQLSILQHHHFKSHVCTLWLQRDSFFDWSCIKITYAILSYGTNFSRCLQKPKEHSTLEYGITKRNREAIKNYFVQYKHNEKPGGLKTIYIK